LIANPDPARVASAGYSYVYMDQNWWQSLPPEIQAAYSQPCVQLLAEKQLANNQDRKLYNVQGCKP
jgi:TRAP-type C4-dicarboxylate transport system substrate-binding protein